jgi:hypothetical protein
MTVDSVKTLEVLCVVLSYCGLLVLGKELDVLSGPDLLVKLGAFLVQFLLLLLYFSVVAHYNPRATVLNNMF